ncbi:hypothetical protein Vafri_8045 [Volvox africanus]|uniref:Guanylate cyclase domain-containing protein n=1 Tax=Volvox africanus TaxID=51714 RepID=A0A8J4B337_9CHLO|nr:hypothetical protein Vafri_8045 [Volvox africanus]
MEKFLSCFVCLTGKEQKQRNHSCCSPEGTTFSRGSDNCSTFPTSRSKPSVININYTSKLELALRYGRSVDAALVLACPRYSLDSNTNDMLCELEPVYCNLSAVKMFGLPVSALSYMDTFEVATEILNAFGKMEPALLQNAREQLRRFINNELRGNLNIQVKSSNHHPQVSSSAQTFSTLITTEHRTQCAAGAVMSSLPAQSAPAPPVAVSTTRPWNHVVLESVMYESSGTTAVAGSSKPSPKAAENSRKNSNNPERQIVQRRRSLLSRVTTGHTDMEENNNCHTAESIKYGVAEAFADPTNRPGDRRFIPALILLFQLHCPRRRSTRQHYSKLQAQDVADLQPASGSRSFGPLSHVADKNTSLLLPADAAAAKENSSSGWAGHDTAHHHHHHHHHQDLQQQLHQQRSGTPILQTPSTTPHGGSNTSKSIADYFRAREGMVLSGLTPMVTAFGGPGCMEVLYQNATSVLYFGLRARPITYEKGRPGPTSSAIDDSRSSPAESSGALAKLFSFEPAKLERLLNDVLTGGRVWRGIVEVPATCHSSLTRQQRHEQLMTNPIVSAFANGSDSAVTARHTNAQQSSPIFQSVTGLQSPIAVPTTNNHLEPPTRHEIPALLPALSGGIRLAKSLPHVQDSNITMTAQVAMSENTAAADPQSSFAPSPRLPRVSPQAAAPVVPTPAATRVSLVADYAGSIIDTYSITLSTADGMATATATATATAMMATTDDVDLDPLRKALGNSDMDPLATSTWGLLIDTPDQHLSTYEFSRRDITDIVSGFVSATGLPYNGTSTNISAAAATTTLNQSFHQSISKTSTVLVSGERSGGSEVKASIAPLLSTPSPPPPPPARPQMPASIAPIVPSARTAGKRDVGTAASSAAADKRWPSPAVLVSRYSHDPYSSRLNDAANANANAGGGRLDRMHSVVCRASSNVERNPHLHSFYGTTSPRRSYSRADLGPADVSGRTVPRFITFASTLRSTPSAAQVAYQTVLASSPSLSSRWSVTAAPPPPTSLATVVAAAAAAAAVPPKSGDAPRSVVVHELSTATEHDLSNLVGCVLPYSPAGPALAMEVAETSASVVTATKTSAATAAAAAVPASFGRGGAGRHRKVPPQLPFCNPRSWTSNESHIKKFLYEQEDDQEDEQFLLVPGLSRRISRCTTEGAVSAAAAAVAPSGSRTVHTADGSGCCDGGFGGSSSTATVTGGSNRGYHDVGKNHEAAAVGGGRVTKGRVINIIKQVNRRGDVTGEAGSGGGDDSGGDGDVSAATCGEADAEKWQQVPPPPALQVTTAAGTCWHEICASRTTDPVTGQYAIVITQTDVTSKVEAERHLAFVTEAEHRLLEQIFPHHVLAYMTEEGGPWAARPTPSLIPTTTTAKNNVASDKTATTATTATADNDNTETPVMPDVTSGYWRPMVRDINKLATSHDQVTLLFADIQGFTPMCKVLEPRVVMAFLNDLFTRFDRRLDEFGVYKVETIGDCYFVAGGLICQDEYGMPAVRALDDPADPQHAERVFNFAKAMLKAASEMSLPTTGDAIKMRIGIHSGPVVSGVVGERMPRFCLFGDTVNTASRMESTGVSGCIHVSESTKNLLGGEDWVPTGGIEVKGKGLMNTYLWTEGSEDQKLDKSSAVTASVAAEGAVTASVAAEGAVTASVAAEGAVTASVAAEGAVTASATAAAGSVMAAVAAATTASETASMMTAPAAALPMASPSPKQTNQNQQRCSVGAATAAAGCGANPLYGGLVSAGH